MKASVFIATSLDGFISRKNGSIDWLTQASETAPPGEDCGYKVFFSSVDTLVMGRNTFEQVLTFDKWPYGDKPVVVMSKKGIEIPPHLKSSVSTTSEAPEKLYQRLSQEGKNHLYVDGGLTIQGFMRSQLIDEITITIAPILLGEGKSLFGPLEKDASLTLIETKGFDFGFVQVKYRVNKH